MKSKLVRPQSRASTDYEWSLVFTFQKQVGVECLKKAIKNSNISISDISIVSGI